MIAHQHEKRHSTRECRKGLGFQMSMKTSIDHVPRFPASQGTAVKSHRRSKLYSVREKFGEFDESGRITRSLLDSTIRS